MNAQIHNSSIVYWDKAYCLGNEKIDSEHKRLFEIASEIPKYSEDSKMIMKIVRELIKYTKIHFKNEEDFMSLIDYKKLEDHKQLHKELIDKLNEIIKDINSNPLEKTVIRLNKFVSKEILHHILVEDKKVHHAIKDRKELKKQFMWRSDYKLRNELLDEEHMKLFEIAMRALDYNNTDIKSHIKIVIKELYDYMKTHFEHEEAYMEEVNYPEFEEHKLLHEEIILQMNQFIKQLPTLKIVEFERKLIEYMDVWLINHILYEDRKITKFLKG